MARKKTHTIKNGNITTAYHDEGSGPVLLLLHGFTGSKLDFHDQMDWFTDRFRVVTPDNRGHGESTNTGDVDSYTIETLADDLHGFIEALGLEDIHLLGHSLGGMVVMRYALNHPEKLDSLILMDTAPAQIEVTDGYFEAAIKLLTDMGTSALVDMFKDAPRSPEAENGIDYLGVEEHWHRIVEKIDQMDLAAYAGLSHAIETMPDITASLAAISCPTTVMVGEADLPFLEGSRRMADTIPRAKLAIIPDAAHCPQYENAERWHQVMEEHLAELI